ncbi:helix-turn-helix protein [Aminobacter sp. MSH1]|nr:helix-turn-helix transcriptional regulator [Aminobacter sp. MSH1]AWC22219.1 helix-turn-helix protein [Aminobacter sp. MSH1]
MITPEQCRAARALVDLSREELANLSGTAHRTIVDFERAARQPRAATLDALRRALEQAGVIFLADGEQIAGGAGVRMTVGNLPCT